MYDRMVTLFPQSLLLRTAEAEYDRAFQGARAAEAAQEARTAAAG